MRYIKDMLIEKAIVHVIDTNADGPLLSMSNLKVDVVIEEFARKHVVKSLKSNDTYAARFLSQELMVPQLMVKLIEEKISFIAASILIAKRMFKIIKSSEVSSCDLLFVEYIADEQRCYGMIKMDHQNAMQHNVSFNEHEEMIVDIIEQSTKLPGTGQAIQKALFFTKGPEDPEVLIIDKTVKKEEGKQDYFLNEFLEAVRIHDDVSKTRVIKPIIERWVQRCLSEDIILANRIRSNLTDMLLFDDVFSIKKLLEMFTAGEEDLRKNIEEYLKEYRFDIKDEFEIDKVHVNKTCKTKTIKTDIGFNITTDTLSFKDKNRIEITNNEDGTINYLIKNVRRVVES